MAEIVLPRLGSTTMASAEILQWLIQEGDAVAEGDPIVAIGTDKVDVDVPAPEAGVITRFLVQPGDDVPVGAPIALIEPVAAERIARIAAPALATPKPAVDVTVPTLPPRPGAKDLVDLRPINASPVAMRIAAKHNIDLSSVVGSGPDSRITKKDVLDVMKRERTPTSVPVHTVPIQHHAVEGRVRRLRAAPAARRVARESGIDLRTVVGTGPKGRIQSWDVQAVLKRQRLAAGALLPELQSGQPPPSRQPLSRLRRVIAERVHASHINTAPVTLTGEVDASALVRAVRRLQTLAVTDNWGFKPGYTDLLIMIAARALEQHPNVNARLVEDGTQIEKPGGIHVGFATDTDSGVLVPVIRQANQIGLRAIGQRLRALAAAAREGTISPDDLQGGTFTLTNLGVYEIDAFTPIINQPETAILGVGRIAEKPVAIDGKVKVRPTMWLSLTFDHRLVDGAPAARFLQTIKRMVEEPLELLV